MLTVLKHPANDLREGCLTRPIRPCLQRGAANRTAGPRRILKSRAAHRSNVVVVGSGAPWLMAALTLAKAAHRFCSWIPARPE